ncbi:hypothetical protein K439DRAFT_1363517, partial [Ramaria rubella]
YGLVVQAHTGHMFTSKYYATNVPSNDVACLCGTATQTRRHMLLDCPRHNNQRHMLTSAVPMMHVADILSTTEGISVFIEVSGAFTKTGEWPKHDRLDPLMRHPKTQAQEAKVRCQRGRLCRICFHEYDLRIIFNIPISSFSFLNFITCYAPHNTQLTCYHQSPYTSRTIP